MASSTAQGSTGNAGVDRHAGYAKGRLLFVSSLALVTAGIAFAMRADTASDLQAIYLTPLDNAHSAEMIANVLGIPFLGFAFTIALVSPVLDVVGMRPFLPLSGLLIGIGSLVMVFADHLATGAGVYTALWVGALIAGVGWGLVETVINPLIATLYPEDKTGKLNRLHAWWPGGLVIGGLLGVALSGMGLNWQVKLGLISVPALAVVILPLGLKFPPTERKAAGVSAGEMFRAAAQADVLHPLLRDVPDGRLRAGARPVGRPRAEPDGAHARHPAARLRERPDVRHAALRRGDRAEAVGDRPAVDLVPHGLARAASR